MIRKFIISLSSAQLARRMVKVKLRLLHSSIYYLEFLRNTFFASAFSNFGSRYFRRLYISSLLTTAASFQ